AAAGRSRTSCRSSGSRNDASRACASRRNTCSRRWFPMRCSCGHSPSPSVVNDGANALALVHQVERLVDVLEAHGVRDEGVQRNLAALRLLHVARQLAAAAHAAERRTAPDAARDQLERTRGNLLARAGHADDDRLAPALVTALERSAHHLHVADALEGAV